MSGKPATLGASRAGVAGAPRVLVYVAEPRQLEAAGAGPDPLPAAAPPFDGLYLHENLPHHISLPRTAIYRSHEHNDQGSASGPLYYKQFNDVDGKVCYGAPDNVVQRPEFYPISHQFLKESCIKVEDGKVLDGSSNLGVKKDCILSTELNSIESFHTQVSIESGEQSVYQARCPVSSDNNMTSMVTSVLRHNHSQADGGVVHSGNNDSINCSDREQLVGKSYVNYQFLEQSVQHQSIVNQSINILNQQVGVSRSVVSEGDSGSPQLMRTADGVVLTVVPSPVPPSNEITEFRTAQSEFPQTISVPLGWRRIVNGSSVLYVSPSGTALSTLPQLRDYLQTTGTCKCGLPCPLRPETAFSFDPKVISKPYQTATGAELTKLCNHKRKLLAALQARAQSPGTPPPQTDPKKTNMETGKKKKGKKRAGYISNMSVSQLMVQRDRTLQDFKSQPHDIELKRRSSPGTVVHSGRPANGQGQSAYPALQQNMHTSIVTKDTEVKQETQIQRSSHYLTVNSGWITHHQEHLEAVQKQSQSSSGHMHPSPLNVGLPVLGTNGQIIGVNTGYNKYPNNVKHMITSQSILEQEQREVKKDIQAASQTSKALKEDATPVFCGLNQALTPEVMQKINEQQQIFIQQNQKQIEVMKGFKTQVADTVNLNKNQIQNQYVPQGQLVVQNGSVVKANSSKTPPWQVKRNDSNTITCPSPKPQKQDNTDYEDSRNSVEESPTFNSYPNNDSLMCSRVPPLPQQYNIMGQQWQGEFSKKRTKSNSKVSKNKVNSTDNKAVLYGNNGVKIIQDPKSKNSDEVLSNNIPSFMDDPSGYLAQQTALLNNTISKQVGMSSSYESHQYDNSRASYNMHNQNEKQLKNMKVCESMNVYRNSIVPNSSPSPNNTPDSSLIPEKGMDSVARCCKGCRYCSEISDSHSRTKYLKQGVYGMEREGNSSTSSPKHGFDDNPVTSSTYTERNHIMSENCGPIQAGIVSTSNVSPTETLQPPEPSPTLSNSSRNTDTPHSSGSSNSQMQNNCTFPLPSPAYSNTGSCRDSLSSNPSTPSSSQTYPYNSPGPPNNQPISGNQMMHFISNHNINKNLMEVDNISMVGVKPGLQNPHEIFRLETKKRMENTMPGYCPPPHLGGGPAHSLIQACYVQTFVTTMASGFSVTRDTVTSVLAGKANTATTSINASQANFVRPPPPPSVNLATTYAIPNNQPDPFINSVNLPTSYPLHIAGTTAQNMISKSPLEMVQNVISSMPLKPETSNTQSTVLSQIGRRTSSGQIVISSTGQILVSNNQMPPPPPKHTTTMSALNSNPITNVTTSITQVVPAVGGVQPLVNQPTVVVNTLPTPFVLQQSMMAVDGQVMQQNQVIPHLVTGGIVPGQAPPENARQIEVKNGQNFVQGVAMLSPESVKKRNKKKKSPAANITNVLQIAAPQQNPNNIMMHHSSPQHSSSPQFSPRGFQLSPTNNISPTPMLQALTIMPGKSGAPAHIVMNGQGNSNNFGSQQIIANTSPSQQINLLQPVNLINNANNVMSNFPAFQQFIVPNLGGMVMTADGTAIIQDNATGMPMQLQIQTVNGQNVFTPVQNPGVFAAGGNSGVVIRAQNQPGKLVQSPHSPGAQFLSPNSQVMMSSPNFNGQLSPLLANLSPTNVTFNTSPHQVRTGNVQAQEFIQSNQMGQTLMVPLSPKQVSIPSASNRNSTFVQQNTTIVQQQTTLVSNPHNPPPAVGPTVPDGAARSSVEGAAHKLQTQKGRGYAQVRDGEQTEEPREERTAASEGPAEEDEEAEEGDGEGGAGDAGFVRHSVSTQTLVRRGAGGAGGGSPGEGGGAGTASSPPDTTTHSPLGALETASARVPARKLSAQPTYADTTTESPEPADASSSAMVQCVSSSEQDMAESRERAWPSQRNEMGSDSETHNMISNMQLMRSNRIHNAMESTEIQYNQSMAQSVVNSQHNVMPMTSTYYERSHSYKRKNEFGDGSTYRTDKIMRSNYSTVHGKQFDKEYDGMGAAAAAQDKPHPRHYPPSGSNSDTSSMSFNTSQKVFDRHSNIGSGDDSKSEDESERGEREERGERGEKGAGRGVREFSAGEVVWGPAKGFQSWPGKLVARAGDGRWSVRWFGGGAGGAGVAGGRVDAARLLTLSEGLEAHHAARTKHRKSRKMNTLLENAIQEAMAELDKKSDQEGERGEGEGGGEDAAAAALADSPKRTKRHDKPRSRDRHHKKSSTKLDGNRLRSSR